MDHSALIQRLLSLSPDIEQFVHGEAYFTVVDDVTGQAVPCICLMPPAPSETTREKSCVQVPGSSVHFSMPDLQHYSEEYRKAYGVRPTLGEAIKYATSVVELLTLAVSPSAAEHPRVPEAEGDMKVSMFPR